ncbi:MAG: complex I NDUFA9 subunit family protein [Betaproteobacteria bacterium]
MKVLLLGGSGFVGTSVAEQLVDRGINVTVPTRVFLRARHLTVLPTVEVIEADILDNERLEQLVCGHDAVINLVGVLHDGKRDSNGRGNFERIHVELPKRIAQACVDTGTPRLLQLSALNASITGPSEYLQSKDRGEAAVMEIAKHHAKFNVSFFRPSVIFGERDRFQNLFADLVKIFPLIMLGSPNAKFQPVWVEDVAGAIVDSLPLDTPSGQAYTLVGPRVYTLRELVKFVMQCTGHSRPIIGLGKWLSMMQAGAFELLPGKLITRDNVRSMSLPNISDHPYPAIFGTPQAMESVVPTWLRTFEVNHAADKNHDNNNGRSRYDHFRHRAGRIK